MLWQRIVTALLLAAVLAVVLLVLPPGLAVAAFAVLVLAGAWEWAAFAGLGTAPARLAYVALVGVVAAGLWILGSSGIGALTGILWVVLAWWVVAFLWLALAPGRGNRVLAGLGGVLALAPLWLGLARLYGSGELGYELVIFVLLLVAAADVGAYFAGRRFGRRKLAPRVSPNKTWEGFLGGLVAAGAVAVAGNAWFGLPPAAFLPLCVAAILASVVGDLTESLFKRQAGLKDSGRLLPGHGGVLDRIDSLCAAVPVFTLGMAWLGVVS
ncbi:MAG: phosphatidate cytidylyltransferase [Steroidobacteraceae bacterium]|jgi:phosphatidate cytidylyltransferase|nr:phosphatidate cytidylyltransferase [Steroidobacteraceae bacterium]